MFSRENFHFNLGIPQLFSEWKAIFSTKYLLQDVMAGTTVAFIAIPLSLAIALASGVSPGTGLITAIIAGIVCAFFGGTPLAVSGPAAAMSIIIADIVERFGVQSLIMICLIAGLLQLLSGICGLGKFGRYVPLPIIAGFTAGIGVIILIGQLPRAFGLAPPEESHIFDVFTHLGTYLHEINGTCIFLVAITIGCIRGLPKVLPKVPPILPAVALASLVVWMFNLAEVPLIGDIPRRLPAPTLPHLPATLSLKELAMNAFVIYLLASLETLLSSSAVDKLSNGKKHNANQELMGQGLGNIAVSLFGGIPITGVIARSATNVRAGAKTRRASIVHSLIILLSVMFAAPLIGLIPIAALAGVLFVVAASMINYHEFYKLWITSRSEASIYLITFLTIIFVDLLAGVQAGILAACLIVLLRATRTHLHITTNSEDGIIRISCVGALTFLSTGVMNDLQKKLENIQPGQMILLDLSTIRNLDSSGASAVIDLFDYCRSKATNFYIKGLPRRFESIFRIAGGAELLDHCYLTSEQDLRQKDAASAPKSSHGRLVYGVYRFYAEREHNDKRLFDSISQKQNPHTLFITCSDSRVIPSMITSSDPGELFIIRNIGNFIPPYHAASQYSEAAALDFALTHFNINDIVICGHGNCGAINACMAGEVTGSASLKNWIALIKSQLNFDENKTLKEIIRSNAINQVENLKQYPIVKEKLLHQTLTIHVWFYDFDESIIYEWTKNKMDFKSLIPEMT
ncbi:MAG: bifunctional SulP family inorganic anion transporter/carbonic anhydrase [Gammaproteobacteria bacterium]|nr:bifunctional SulP family inorganic anion transporter/carbonic anhydrase [Gammaproteobacteria bacterium]